MDSNYKPLASEAKEYYLKIRDTRLNKLELISLQLENVTSDISLLGKAKDDGECLEPLTSILAIETIKQKRTLEHEKLQLEHNKPVVPNSTYACPECSMISVYAPEKKSIFSGRTKYECQLCDTQYKKNLSNELIKIK